MRRLLLLGLALLCALLLPALAVAGNNARAIIDARPGYGPLFLLQKNGRSHYLYGTIHVGKPGYAQPDWGLLTAIARSQALVVELDPADTSQQQSMLAALKQLAATQWPMLPATQREALLALAARQGMDAAQATAMPPGMLVLGLGLSDAVQAGFSAAYGSDMMLLASARRRDMAVYQLETAEQQGRLLASLPLALLAENIRYQQQPGSDKLQRKQLLALSRAWERGDLAALEAQLQQPGLAQTSAWIEEHMMRRRNLQMRDKIDKLAGRQTLLIAVGALHLVGRDGLLALLREQGYQISAAPRALAARPQP